MRKVLRRPGVAIGLAAVVLAVGVYAAGRAYHHLNHGPSSRKAASNSQTPPLRVVA